MKIKLIVILLLAYLFKELIWLAIIPIWHFPDEEQHFGQVAFIAEKGQSPAGFEKDINKEIDQSAYLLGVKRDPMGVNRFTYHPEFRIAYGNNNVGIYEREIRELNTNPNRLTMVKREAARYGPVFYYLTTVPYKIFWNSNLFIRVFSSRLISVFLSLATVFVVYLIGKEIWKQKFLAVILTLLVGFQPMFSFVSAGVNSDNLFNLVFTLILFFIIKVFFSESAFIFIKNKIISKFINLVLLGLFLIVGYYTKQQIIISLPIIFFGLVLSVFKKKKQYRIYYFLIFLLFSVLLLIIFKNKIRIPGYSPEIPSKLNENLWQYIFWHLKHTIAETIPWYWGVFNWLGVTLPRWVLRVQARLMVIVVFGVGLYFIKNLKSQKNFINKNLILIFLLGSGMIYYFAIILWDYFFRQSVGFSFGIQGRYFFPTISSHMTIIVLGFEGLFPKKVLTIGLKILSLWWFVFSVIGLKTAVQSYYQLWPIQTFLNQASQYKPELLKSGGIIVLITCFVFFTILLEYRILINERKNT